MPIIDDIIRNLQLAIDSLWYNVLMMLAQAHWGLLRGVFMMGHTVELLNNWLTAQAFAPLIQQTGDSLRVVTSMIFVVALFVLGVTYMLASIVRLDVVSPRSAILWYLAGMVFFQVGPALYGGMNDLRRTLSSAFYLSTLDAMRGEAGSALSSLNSVQTSDLGILVPCDNFGPYLGRPGGHGAPILVNGLDVALAYLRADGIDVMGYPYPTSDNCQPHVPPQSFPIPWEWSMPGSFFDNVKGPAFFPVITDEERAQSISMAGAAQWRLLSAWPLVLFGLFEQIVGLCLTIAQGLTFISMACAILFAFFRRTEGIAWSVVDLWVELLVQTVVIALVQALVVALFLAGAATNNGLVVLGLGLVCLVFMTILMLSGLRAIWRSFNRLFDALGKATGGNIIGLGTATQAVVGAGAATVSGGTALAGNTLGGASALMQGASWAQAAGVALGGATALTSAARTLVHLPGVRDTALADVADQFVEGAVTRRVAGDVPIAGHITGPLAGAMLLSDRRPDKAKVDDAPPMLVPTVGEVVEGLARGPRWKRADEVEEITVAHQRSDYVEQETGEEMEQHLTGVARETQSRGSGSEAGLSRLDAASSRLERAAETLERAARQFAFARAQRQSAAEPTQFKTTEKLALVGSDKAVRSASTPGEKDES